MPINVSEINYLPKLTSIRLLKQKLAILTNRITEN